MGEYLQNTWKKIQSAWVDISRFWPRILGRSLLFALIAWIAWGFVDIMFTFVSYLIALINKENPVFPEFIEKHYLSAAVWVFGFFFLCLLVRESAGAYREKEKLAWRRTWRDVEIKAINFSHADGLAVGFLIVSDKPDEHEITNFYPKITKILCGRSTRYESNIPDIGIELEVFEQKSKTGSFYHRTDALNVPHRKNIGKSVIAFQIAYFYAYSSQTGGIEEVTRIEGVIEENGKEPRHYGEAIDLPCEVEIVLSGLLNTSDKMDMCKIAFEIIRNEEKGLVLTAVRRSPDYEYRK